MNSDILSGINNELAALREYKQNLLKSRKSHRLMAYLHVNSLEHTLKHAVKEVTQLRHITKKL